MALPNKPTIKNVWATSGVKVEPSDTKVNAGWIVERPPHQFQNFLQNRSDQFLKHINEAGIPVWDAATVYTANRSYVQGSDGKLYKALTNGANQNPVGNPTNWMLTLGDADFQEIVDQAQDSATQASAAAADAIDARDTAESAATAANSDAATAGAAKDQSVSSATEALISENNAANSAADALVSKNAAAVSEANAAATLAGALKKIDASADDGTKNLGFKRSTIASTIPIDLYNWLSSTAILDVECGVVGDNTADDTLALNILTAAGKSSGSRVMCRPGANYKITGTVHINCNADFSGSTFNAPSSLAAPVIKTSGTVAGAQLIYLNIKYPTVKNNRADGAAPTLGSIGIQIEAARDCRFEIDTINGFEEGLQLYSNNGTIGFVSYNTLYVNGLIWRNKINLHLKTELTGWVNQCTFIGGQFAQINADNLAFGTTNVQITKVDTGGNNPPNGHTFIGCSMEGAFTTTIKYALNPAIVTSYASCNTWVNCRMEAAVAMDFAIVALGDMFINCLGAYNATYANSNLPNVLGGFRLFRYTMDIAAIPGVAGFRTAINTAMFQAGNSGAALAISAGQSGRINAGITANGAFVTFHPTDPTKLFATTSVNTGGGIPKWECGDGTVVAPDYIGWFANNDWRMKGSFTPVTDATYALGSAARKWTTISLSGGVGYYGSVPVAKQTLAVAATDAATTQTLVNDIRAKLIAIGLMS